MERHGDDMEWSINSRRNKHKTQTLWMPKLCRQKLLGYAESMRDISNNFSDEREIKSLDRQVVFEEKIYNENRQVVSENLNTAAYIIESVAEEMAAYTPMEDRRRKIITAALKNEGITVTDSYYMPNKDGMNSIGLYLYSRKKSGYAAENVADILTVILHKPFQLSATSPIFIDREEKSYIFVEETPFVVITGMAKAVKDMETISGDNYAVLESERGRVTLLLSDGTGSGDEACSGSERVLDLMEKMLEAGYDNDMAVKMVNNVFFALEQESNHPTLDICELDLYSGACKINKVGAAATFVKKADRVDMVIGDSLPLGLVREASTDSAELKLESGDYVIMMTDGVLEALEEQDYEQEMVKLIKELNEQNPEGIAEKLLHKVLCLSKGVIRDDMTILAAGLWENSKS